MSPDRPFPKARPLLATAGAAVLALALAACGSGGGGSSGKSSAGTSSSKSTAAMSMTQAGQPSPVRGTQTIPLKVIHGKGGSTLAIVPVFIAGQGPFAFAVDTGASQSNVDRELVSRLHLKTLGGTKGVTGVSCQSKATKVNIGPWRAGQANLPARTVLSLDLPPKNAPGKGLRGLLGSDVLSHFNAVTVDYQRQTLTLR